MSTRNRYAPFPQPELQLQLAVQQPASRAVSNAPLAAIAAARSLRWANALRASSREEGALAASVHDQWLSQRTSQLNTIALQRACGKRSH